MAQTIEITPFFGFVFEGNTDDSFRFDDDFGFDDLEVDEGEVLGVAFDLSVTKSFQLEVFYSVQETTLEISDGFLGPVDLALDLDLEYLHAGGLYQWNAPNGLRPFISASLGATRFSPNVSDFDDETRFSVAVGGGIKLLFSDHVGLRLQGRLLSTFIDEDEDVFCNRSVCYRYDDETYLYQVEASAGLIFAF